MTRRFPCSLSVIGLSRIAVALMPMRTNPGGEISAESQASPPQILIVDDHDFTRAAVRRLLEMNRHWQICGEAADGQEAVEAAKRLRPDVIVMDLNMPRMNGLQAADRISRTVPQSRVLLFTIQESDKLPQVSQTGIWGVVSKLDAARELPEAVETVLHGKHYYHDGDGN